jgi:hypothetical protein
LNVVPALLNLIIFLRCIQIIFISENLINPVILGELIVRQNSKLVNPLDEKSSVGRMQGKNTVGMIVFLVIKSVEKTLFALLPKS